MVSIKGIIKDVIIVAVCISVIWIGVQSYFGTPNPFYVVSSGSMYPELAMYDIIVVTGHAQFDDVRVGDIIVFDRPKDQAKVIVHRVVAVIEDDQKILRTKGDNNQLHHNCSYHRHYGNQTNLKRKIEKEFGSQ